MPERVLPQGLIWPSRAAETLASMTGKEGEVCRGEPGFKRQYERARDQLLVALVAEQVRTAFLVTSNGTVRTLPGRFWHTPQQDSAWHGDYRSLADHPREQFWHFEENDRGWGYKGFALVEKASMLAHFDPRKDNATEIPWPHPGEYKTTYILRVMNLTPLRRIVTEETLPIAEAWLRARGKPHEEKDIRHQAKLMIAIVGGLPKKK